ncbi:hypothetical protein HN419_07715 [Candidatus Woesearchaeota archaeon]|nr:hypothetical protein [Candidatus Woesearchaeota archaeon]MBT3538377.1 hypothetical protein [Candidatus Woesearchaeota archaeon]MBT4697044.1 hypothetical protein [Candidatus Woesearchaeota archaeon]MBT4717175.1 hypothetical protein [Candidatus Woesearchaeota archaeon]MBT7106046.1 hypothetical protein [Candidatus Woesearchaeota archaeon]
MANDAFLDAVRTSCKIGALFFRGNWEDPGAESTLNLKDGRTTPYFFNAGAFNTGSLVNIMGDAFAEMIAADIEGGTLITHLFGPAYKGNAIATATALSLYHNHDINLPFVFDDKVSGRLVFNPHHTGKGMAEVVGEHLDDVVSNIVDHDVDLIASPSPESSVLAVAVASELARRRGMDVGFAYDRLVAKTHGDETGFKGNVQYVGVKPKGRTVMIVHNSLYTTPDRVVDFGRVLEDQGATPFGTMRMPYSLDDGLSFVSGDRPAIIDDVGTSMKTKVDAMGLVTEEAFRRGVDDVQASGVYIFVDREQCGPVYTVPGDTSTVQHGVRGDDAIGEFLDQNRHMFVSSVLGITAMIDAVREHGIELKVDDVMQQLPAGTHGQFERYQHTYGVDAR